jgi:hypothetical protein
MMTDQQNNFKNISPIGPFDVFRVGVKEYFCAFKTNLNKYFQWGRGNQLTNWDAFFTFLMLLLTFFLMYLAVKTGLVHT